MTPTNDDVSHALRSIEATELPDNHPRKLAREAIAEFRSNAQREGLPIANQIDSGAPLLRRDEVVRASYPTYATSGSKRSLWAKLFRWR